MVIYFVIGSSAFRLGYMYMLSNKQEAVIPYCYMRNTNAIQALPVFVSVVGHG